MFRKSSIRLKLTLITAASSMLALILASAGFLYLDLSSYKSQVTTDMNAEARVLGRNCGQAIVEGRKEEAEDVLSALSVQPQISAASLYLPDGKLFASYVRRGAAASVPPFRHQASGAEFRGDRFEVTHKISFDKKTVGYLFIESSLDQWVDRRDQYAHLVALLFLVCLAVATIVSLALHGLIVRPIVQLDRVMRQVAEDEQYDRRAIKTSDDELGRLVEGFNSMVSRIEQRDRELHEANQELEDRVRRRTLQLQLEIDQRRDAQEELVKSQHSLNDFFENATVGLHWLAADGTVLKVNNAELQMLGYDQDEYLDQKISEFHPDPAVIEDILMRLKRGEVLHGYEAQMRCKDGRLKDVEIDANVLWQAGKFVHARCFVRDLTDKKEAERAMIAREQAERANYAKSEFLSRMSHELRTPMNSILGFSQLLAIEDLTLDQADSVQQIINAGTHLLGLINEILDISRIESGNLAISKEPVAIADVIREVASLVHPFADQKKVVVIAHTAEAEGCHVLADRQRLCQVLLNLVSNAIKYNHECGEVRIEVDSCGGQIRLRVVDNGPGIPKNKRSALFTPFDRLGAEHTTVEGTGLGLALSKALTEAMGGAIGMEDVPKGASFFVDLPVAISPVQANETSDSFGAGSSLGHAHSQTILLVEDNLSNVRLVEKVLANRRGIRLITAMQGMLAIELAKEHVPDLILLDLNLPDIHGEQVLQRLREEPATENIPVAVVSADATPSQMDRLRAAGAAAYLTKPLDIKEFNKVLDEALNLPGVKQVA